MRALLRVIAENNLDPNKEYFERKRGLTSRRSGQPDFEEIPSNALDSQENLKVDADVSLSDVPVANTEHAHETTTTHDTAEIKNSSLAEEEISAASVQELASIQVIETADLSEKTSTVVDTKKSKKKKTITE